MNDWNINTGMEKTEQTPNTHTARQRKKRAGYMEVVEDFIYLNCSPSTSILQVINVVSMYKAFVEIGEVKKHPV